MEFRGVDDYKKYEVAKSVILSDQIDMVDKEERRVKVTLKCLTWASKQMSVAFTDRKDRNENKFKG